MYDLTCNATHLRDIKCNVHLTTNKKKNCTPEISEALSTVMRKNECLPPER